MRLTGYQPQYFPRLHYFARILNGDIFTFSDTYQFVRAHKYPTSEGGHKRGKSYQADTLFKGSKGAQYLSVPIQHHGLMPINETKIAYNERWQEKHLRGIQINYASAQHFKILFPQLTAILLQPYEHLAQLNIITTLWALNWILSRREVPIEDISVAQVNELLQESRLFRLRNIYLKSELNLPKKDGDDATDKIITTCRLLGADEYHCGGTAFTAYIDEPRLQLAGIKLVQQEWTCQTYTQQFPQLGFLANLSILDLLMNEDSERSRQILQG